MPAKPLSTGVSRDEIWILGDVATIDLFTQYLSIRFCIRVFETIHSMSVTQGRPALAIVDLEGLRWEDALLRLSHLNVMIVSHEDSLDFAQACRNLGVVALHLKPLRPSEVFMTLERLLSLDLLPNDLESGAVVTGLTLKERRLLAVLRVSGKPLSRQELFDALWAGVNVNRKTLDVHLFNLRRKIRSLGVDIIFEAQTYRLQPQPSVGSEQFSAS